MHRPRNRQPRRGTNNQDPRERGNRNNYSNSNSNPRSHSHRSSPRASPSLAPVPNHSSLTPGTPVSIVLKVDQPTGQQVQGILAEVLTRGDHPRSVKVRLRDGRVGRVQRLVSEEEGIGGEELAGCTDVSLGRNGNIEDGRGARERGGKSGRGRGRFTNAEDVSESRYLWDESRDRSLGEYFDWMEELEERDRENGRWTEEETRMGLEFGSATATCPVCGTFEGDESAVAHHVEGHFQDGG